MSEIRIPQGMRDLILDECERKRELQKRIESVFRSFGYREIMTPVIEYYDTYENAFANVDDAQMYKFFDQDGNILALREDMTVPIARVCASKFAKADPPFRFFYTSDVFKVRHMFAGKRSEVTDCGVELIGLDEKSDVEVLYTALKVMETMDCADYVLEIGNSGFFRSAAESLHLNADVQEKLADLIDRKSLVELDQYLDELQLREEEKDFFRQLPLLGGKEEALDQAEALSFSDELREEVRTLRNLYQTLTSLGKADHILFDFGKVPHLDYYTGIIFEGYVSEAGTSVLSGGRYDGLLKKFGRDLPACGFSVKLDYLLDAVEKNTKKKVRLFYPKEEVAKALVKAEELRKDADVEMIPWDETSMEVKA